jgi:Fe-S-cluster containining protein
MLLAAECQMEYTGFVKTYCRWIPAGAGIERLSLKEKSNYDCIFWEDGCGVYAARPLQCRTFPFWASILDSPESWAMAKSGCPGMDRGRLFPDGEIEALLAARREDPVLRRHYRETP